jgi:hypothetical protein
MVRVDELWRQMTFLGTDLKINCEIPPNFAWSEKVFPDMLRTLKVADGLIAAEMLDYPPGAGVWRIEDGELLWWNVRADLVRLLESSMLSCVDQRQQLVRFSWPDLTPVETIEAPQFSVTLIVSASEKLLLVYQDPGGGECGYEVFSLDGPLRKLSDHIGPTVGPMGVQPIFSPSERLVACCPGNGGFWLPPENDRLEEWMDELDEMEIPSFGGKATFATLILHDLSTDVVTKHDLQVDLEPGWVPDSPQDERWENGAAGLVFATEDQLRLQLPDDSWIELSLPLPETVLLPTPNRRLPYA